MERNNSVQYELSYTRTDDEIFRIRLEARDSEGVD
jgi:hypothetical protein